MCSVLWLDANVEVRRPLDELRELLAADGHFASVTHIGFPEPLRHFDAVVRSLGCGAAPFSRVQTWTGAVGVVRGSWFHREVRRLRACANLGICVRAEFRFFGACSVGDARAYV